MRILKTIALIGLVFIVMTSNINGVFSYNKTCDAFTGECDNDGDGTERTFAPSLKQLIIDSAGYYMQSNGFYQQFLNKVELSEIYGINFWELAEIIDNALVNMELSNAVYYELWQTSKTLDYNSLTLYKLKQFNYADYQKEHGLNLCVFDQVSDRLRAGDVIGVYENAYNDTLNILDKLRDLKASIYAFQLPEVADCWRITQFYFETQLYGQYVSEVFFAILR